MDTSKDIDVINREKKEINRMVNKSENRRILKDRDKCYAYNIYKLKLIGKTQNS